MKTYRLSKLRACLCVAALVASSQSAAQTAIEEIVVRSEILNRQLADTASSISIIDASEIENRNASFLTDALATVPNVNFSAGASRGRFFQIRGIGERSQFVDPINPGVGLLVDGIDFATLGGAATLNDVQQVEVLRGPQGTLFGANALAGMIQIHSNEPLYESTTAISLGASEISGNSGSIDGWKVGLVANRALGDTVAARLAVQQNTSDGYMRNSYLDRDDTQNLDEFSARLRLRWDLSDQFKLGAALLRLDNDNGYDGFTLDNSRNSLADQPGRDTLRANAIAINGSYSADALTRLEFLASSSVAEALYSYDEDWTNPDICAGQPCDGWEYAGFDQYLRDTRTDSLDLRMVSQTGLMDWVIGLYGRNQQQDLERDYTWRPFFTSSHQSRNRALYGELKFPLAERWDLGVGARAERFTASYRDLLGQTSAPAESLNGGHITLQYRLAENHDTYLRLARGYKSGGVNASTANNPGIPLTYATESLWNYELGLRSRWIGGVQSSLSLFAQYRRDAQIKQSLVECPTTQPACTFEDYTDNAARVKSVGLEAELVVPVNNRLQLMANLGLMDAEFTNYLSFSHVNADPNAGPPVPFDMRGEPVAQSPRYQAVISADFTLTDSMSFWVAFEAKDSFRFSNRHLAEAEPHGLLNARLRWTSEQMDVSLWGRNLTDKTYYTRGFGEFANDPRDFYSSEGPYFQLGDPRELGVTLNYRF